MSGETKVKVFRVEGLALFSPDRSRRWQPFTIDVRALKPEEAVEKVYSDMGSRHKLKRAHIKIINIREISPEESKYKFIKSLETFSGWSIE
ncbi:MAG: 50S ribosomal protein L18Ae [Sulfolobales archaeon]